MWFLCLVAKVHNTGPIASDVHPEPCPFPPKQVVRTDDVCWVFGADGEVMVLDDSGTRIGGPARPFPMAVRNAVACAGGIMATWMDHELRVARLALLRGPSLHDGPSRADVRKGMLHEHPAGHAWSHALDAEPLSLGQGHGGALLSLWPNGLYFIDDNGEEQWRASLPADENDRRNLVVDLVRDGHGFIATMRDGTRCMVTREGVLPLESESVDYPLEAVFHGEGSRLLVTTDHTVHWVEGGHTLLMAKLSGPVGEAVWSVNREAWCIGGWRERVELTRNGHRRWPCNELDVALVPFGDGGLLCLDNRGSWKAFPK